MELELIRWLSARMPSAAPVVVGIGDDASVMDWPAGQQCVVTTDMLAAGVHFPKEGPDLRRVGRKALAVNLSDIAAMAARPLAAYVSLMLPRGMEADDVQPLYEGMLPLAERYNVTLAGGDTNVWDGALVINVTLIGACPTGSAMRRDGARPGDVVFVTGELGGSILGKHFEFEPRIEEAQTLAASDGVTAGSDISDGLALDLWRIVQASGVGAVLDEWRIPVSDAARELAARDPARGSALEHALSDGEDFELLLVVAPHIADQWQAASPIAVPLTRIGTIVAERGLWMRANEAAEPVRLPPRGYEHGIRGSTGDGE